MMKFNKEEVLKVLPHRDPFLFVDEVVEVTGENEVYETPKDLVGVGVKAKYFTRPDHPIFEGHFPGNPILPGVVQVEMMAQASIFGLKLLYTDLEDRDFEVALLSIESSKFRKPVTPSMELTIQTKCKKMRTGFLQNECKIFCGEELMSEAVVFATFSIK